MTISLKFYLTLIIVALSTSIIKAQTASAGPVIKDFGKVFKIAKQDYKIDPSSNFYVVFDVSKSPKDTTSLNNRIETAARFLNMHAQNGVELDKMKVALVIHGSAYKDIMTNEAYNKKFGTNNPNEKLNKVLLNNNVEIIMCGQSASYRGLKKDEIIPGIKLSLSAMTALIQLQNQNYRVINF